MRIIGGEFRGRRLASVGKGDATAQLRPTSDRVRESLFNVLAGGYGDAVSGVSVLDLFAGTGALGLEALSRGAADVTFVESGRVALRILGENIALCRVTGQSRVLNRDARKIGPNPGDPKNLIFMDPPYGRILGEAALKSAIAGNWIAKGALIIWEENTAIECPPGATQTEARRYGDTTVSILRWNG